MSEGPLKVLDLVCGPESPLPDSQQRYRLLEHVGTGGQAEVYRGVRLSHGVRSASVSVKIFRHDPHHPLVEQLVAWDKGDAVLMDLNSRGIPGICQRIDGFSGVPPRRPDQPLGAATSAIPYQVLSYVPGKTVIERLRDDRVASGGAPSNADGTIILAGLAETLRQLHQPVDGATPVVHMDVKPSNVLILPNGQACLIDFTASRYHDNAHLTTVAYSPSSGGPEAHQGAASVGLPYDIHGFGSVAYYLVTGWHPRQERAGAVPDGREISSFTEIRRHPLLDSSPALASHLLAPLADRPGDRPRADELHSWVGRLVELVRGFPEQIRLTYWGDPPHRGPVAETRQAPHQAPANPPTPHPGSTSVMPVLRPSNFSGSASVRNRADNLGDDASLLASGGASSRRDHPYSEGRQRQHSPFYEEFFSGARVASRGRGFSVLMGLWLGLCWAVWLGTAVFSRYSLGDPMWGVGIAAAAALGVWWLTRLAGYLLRSTFELGPRRSTLIQNLTTGTFMALCGAAFLSRTPLALGGLVDLVRALSSQRG